jgi:hypothetical protein
MRMAGSSSILMRIGMRIGGSSSRTLALLVCLALTFQDMIETGSGNSSASIAMSLITRRSVFCDYGGNTGAPMTTGDHIRHPQVGVGEFCFMKISVRCAPPAS